LPVVKFTVEAIMALPLGAVQIAVVSFIAYTLATVALGLRFWSRALLKLPLRSADYMIILAMVNTSGAVAVFLAGNTNFYYTEKWHRH
jgi:membrane protein implicated in regulation of membrane protease activity